MYGGQLVKVLPGAKIAVKKLQQYQSNDLSVPDTTLAI